MERPNGAPVGFNRNVLFTCLGSPTRPVFHVTGPVPLHQGDRIMLCSDGLWGRLRGQRHRLPPVPEARG